MEDITTHNAYFRLVRMTMRLCIYPLVFVSVFLSFLLFNLSCKKENIEPKIVDSATVSPTTNTTNTTNPTITSTTNTNTTNTNTTNTINPTITPTINPSTVTQTVVTTTANVSIVTRYPLSVNSTNRVASIVVPSSTFAYWNANYYGGFTGNWDSVKVISNIVYQRFKDEFDFIFIITNNQTKPSSQPYGVNFAIQNKVQGIGKSIFNNAASYGSSGKLLSFMWLPWKYGIGGVTSNGGFYPGGPTLHELCHNWANHIPVGIFKTIDDTNPNLPEKDANDGHWGISDVGGQLGGFASSSFQSNVDGDPLKYHGHIGSSLGFGLNANGGNSVPYAPLELYMMGLISKADVPPIRTFSGINANVSASTIISAFGNGNFWATTMRTYTIDELIQASGIGQRVPDFTASQKEYRTLVLVITPSALTTDEWTVYDDQVSSFFKKGDDGVSSIYNFWEATGGRGWVKADDLNLIMK